MRARQTAETDTKQTARKNLVELLERDRVIGSINALIHSVRYGSLAKSERYVLEVQVLSSIKMLRDDLLAWAKAREDVL